MNMTRRDFWTEALKGGTLIGLVTVAFSLLTQTAGERATLVEILGYASTIITILLLAGYLRRFARMHSRAEGFSYGRGVGFVVAMMLFVGVLSGVYSAVMTNFFIKEEILASVDAAMAQYQDMIQPSDADHFVGYQQRPVWTCFGFASCYSQSPSARYLCSRGC